MAALVCIALDEDKYIEEWIDYHLKLGFTKIFIYDNDEKYPLRKYDEKYSYKYNNKVKVIYFPGENKQLRAYKHFLNRYKSDYTWVAFFDVDEFLVLHKHKNIEDFCNEYVKSGAIGVNWVLFGNNNNNVYDQRPVLERFTKRKKRVDKHVKTIAKCTDINEMIGVHCPKLNNGYFHDSDYNMIFSSFNELGNNKICQINHYFTKSTEEFKQKCNRRCADGGKKRVYEEHLYYLDFNDIEDLAALKFFTKI